MPGEEPVISPDGKKVAFVGANGVGVYVETIDGTNVRKITSISPLLRDPGVAWSPDSQSVIFSGPRADPTNGCSDIYIVPAGGGPTTQVPITTHGTDPQCVLPTFTRDGKDIIFYGYDIDPQTNKRTDFRIYSVPISGGAASAIPGSGFGFNTAGAYLPRVSPDGSLIAFMSITTGTSPSSEIETIPIGGGSVTDLGPGLLWPWRRSPLTVNQTSSKPDTAASLAQGICNVGDPSTPDQECTLRAAIQVVNAAPSKPETIHFDIPGGGIPTISPLSPLPAITTKGITLDATSQPGGWVDLSGPRAKAGGADGLTLSAAEDVVQGFAIGGFSGDGILIDSKVGGDTVSGNRIGTSASAKAADPNANGVYISSSPNNTIGGTGAGDGNLISGNSGSGFEGGGFGVYIRGSPSTGNKVQGNDIGTGLGGVGSLPNDINGVLINGASNNTIGGSASASGSPPGNTIVGGTKSISIASGVLIAGQKAVASGDVVSGNRVGVDSEGHLAASTAWGVLVAGHASDDTIGGPGAGDRNVVSGASEADIGLESTEATGIKVLNNWVGTNATGSAALSGSKTQFGIATGGVASTTIGQPGAGNTVVTPDNGIGIEAFPTSNAICACLPGSSATATGRTNNTIAGNQVGYLGGPVADLGTPGKYGVVDVAGSGDTVGPDNIVDWNSGGIILLNTAGVSIAGNRIGAGGPNGVNAAPNGNGIALLGTEGTTVNRSNLVADFGEGGIWVMGSTIFESKSLDDPLLKTRHNTQTVISGNGVDSQFARPKGVQPPNGRVLQFPDEKDKGVGIIVESGADGTTIGGTSKSDQNVLIEDKTDGILIDGAPFDAPPVGTVIEGNAVGVGKTGNALGNGDVGINVQSSGVTIGGTATGAGNLIANNDTGVFEPAGVKRVTILSNSIWHNSLGGIREQSPQVPAPVISSAKLDSGTLTLDVQVHETVGVLDRIQVFSDPSCGAVYHSEGEALWGGAAFTGKATGGVSETVKVTRATAWNGITTTLTEGPSTSEFSDCVRI